MRDFFKNKQNLIFIILIGVSLIGVLIASFWDAFVPISCILFGILCIFVAYLFFKKFITLKNRKTDEFISEENKLKKRTSKFLEAESRTNVVLLAVLFLAMGGILIIYSLKMF